MKRETSKGSCSELSLSFLSLSLSSPSTLTPSLPPSLLPSPLNQPRLNFRQLLITRASAAENLSNCVSKLDDLFPARQGSPLRKAVSAASSTLAGQFPSELGVTPFTAFVTVDGKFLGNDSNPIERKIFDQFSKGLPKEKQAS